MNIEVEVTELHREKKIAITVKVPFDSYAESLYPNEALRESLIAALDNYLMERR